MQNEGDECYTFKMFGFSGCGTPVEIRPKTSDNTATSLIIYTHIYEFVKKKIEGFIVAKLQDLLQKNLKGLILSLFYATGNVKVFCRILTNSMLI